LLNLQGEVSLPDLAFCATDAPFTSADGHDKKMLNSIWSRKNKELQGISERLLRLETLTAELQTAHAQLSDIQRHRWELEDRVNHLSEYGIKGSSDRADRAETRSAYVSLGWNCEAAYQFRRVVGSDRSSFFNWTYCNFKSMINIIDNDFNNLLQWENICPSGVMIYDRANDIAFHGAVFHGTDRGKFVELAKYHLASLQSKTAYLIGKWRKLTKSNTFATYYIKLPDLDDRRSAAGALRDTMKTKYPDHKFRIVVLGSLENAKSEPEWGEPEIYNRYLERFAPDDDPAAGDARSWDRIFAEFPLDAE
jgi:Putative papain-like cysteine peptidase (DUF1796)